MPELFCIKSIEQIFQHHFSSPRSLLQKRQANQERVREFARIERQEHVRAKETPNLPGLEAIVKHFNIDMNTNGTPESLRKYWDKAFQAYQDEQRNTKTTSRKINYNRSRYSKST